jgi:hypothetical protein
MFCITTLLIYAKILFFKGEKFNHSHGGGKFHHYPLAKNHWFFGHRVMTEFFPRGEKMNFSPRGGKR